MGGIALKDEAAALTGTAENGPSTALSIMPSNRLSDDSSVRCA